jgi:gamma-glutamyltranspeptidase/glutathione hydrolase
MTVRPACALLALALSAPLRAEWVEKPVVTAREAVVGSLDPLSTMAGMKILMQGGNAFDAAVAVAVATTVVDPKNSSIGGQGFATMYVAREKEVRALNFFGPAPKTATAAALAGKVYASGYLATPVPSNLRGYQELLSRYGTRTWPQVLAPAIELAEKGFVVREEFAGRLREFEKTLGSFPETRRVYFPKGRLPVAGEIFVQSDLAETLKRIAAGGPDVFYTGDVGRSIADFYQAHGGLLTREDLADYRARWVTPVSTTYRGYAVYTQPPNSSAAVLLLQLNLLEGFDLRALGHNSAAYLHLVGEVMRVAIADRNGYIGDPDFTDVPIAKILSKEYAAERRKLISLARTIPAAAKPGAASVPHHTTHLTVVDREGNMVALTQTLGEWFGSGVVAGDTGVLFSNQMRHLHLDPKSPSRVEPGKRPRSNQSPTIVLKDGKPFMAIGTPGSDAIWQRLAQAIVNVVDFGMDIQQAISSPRMIYGSFQETGTDIPAPTFEIESKVPTGVVAALKKKGYTMKVIDDDDGRLTGIVIDPVTGFRTGGADPRSCVYAMGW